MKTTLTEARIAVLQAARRTGLFRRGTGWQPRGASPRIWGERTIQPLHDAGYLEGDEQCMRVTDRGRYALSRQEERR